MLGGTRSKNRKEISLKKKEKISSVMFRWKDYKENTCLFVDEIDTNVAVLRYKDF